MLRASGPGSASLPSSTGKEAWPGPAWSGAAGAATLGVGWCWSRELSRLFCASLLLKLLFQSWTSQYFTGTLPDDSADTEKKILIKKWLDLLF